MRMNIRREEKNPIPMPASTSLNESVKIAVKSTSLYMWPSKG